MILDLGDIFQDGHHNGAQRLHFNHRKTLPQQLLQLQIPLLALRFANFVYMPRQLVAKRLKYPCGIGVLLDLKILLTSTTDMWKSRRRTPCRSNRGSMGRSDGSRMPFVTWEQGESSRSLWNNEELIYLKLFDCFQRVGAAGQGCLQVTRTLHLDRLQRKLCMPRCRGHVQQSKFVYFVNWSLNITCIDTRLALATDYRGYWLCYLWL